MVVSHDHQRRSLHDETGDGLRRQEARKILATLALSKRKPWAIDKTYFAPVPLPLYLTSMAVAPAHQRKDIGAQCVEEAKRITRAWPADSIRLDAYDAAGGAGGFYAKCGFREVGRVVYRTTPLIYYEWLVSMKR